MSNVIAVIWDYDGTIVDTRYKNLSVQKKLVGKITGKSEREFPALRSVSNYQVMHNKIINWQDQYKNYFGMTENQIREAGILWSQLQKTDETETPVYSGVIQIIGEIKNIPQGIFSQNSREQILTVLKNNKLQHYFNEVIGFEQLASNEQKPSPAGLLKIINYLCGELKGVVLFIGDHSTDFKCTNNAKSFYDSGNSRIKIFSVGVNYTPERNAEKWTVSPDYIADRPTDIIKIINKLNIVK